MTMLNFMKTALPEVLDAFASSEPVPGGGSASALTGALGVSLLLMVAGMEKTRSNAPQDVADLAAATARLRPIREELMAIIEEDSRAYVDVLIALKLPRSTDGETTTRRAAVAHAMRVATEVPLRTMRLCAEALREAPIVAKLGNPNAATDAAVGATLLFAALESAGLNVSVNLPGVTDAEFARLAGEERQSLLAGARASVNLVEHP